MTRKERIGFISRIIMAYAPPLSGSIHLGHALSIAKMIVHISHDQKNDLSFATFAALNVLRGCHNSSLLLLDFGHTLADLEADIEVMIHG